MQPVRKEANSPLTPEQVLTQDPEAFQSATPGSKVTLQVANGKLQLPDVSKQTFAAAKVKLNQLGFAQVVSQDSEVQDGFKVGQVMSVDPTPGIWYDKNTKITLTVAVAKKLPQCTTPASSSTPPVSGSTTPPAGSSSTSGSPPSPSPSPTCTP